MPRSRPPRPRSKPGSKTRKRPTNLSLDVDALERGEIYSRLHGTSVSRLVNDYLRSLPADERLEPLSPVVRRLRGIAAGAEAASEEYRRHLRRKYGSG
ncbi:MAG: DUF6364 family protein [Gemmatimonadaceae bacterium]